MCILCIFSSVTCGFISQTRLFLNKVYIGVGQFVKVASRTVLKYVDGTPTPYNLNKAAVYHSYHRMQDRDACLALQYYQPKMKLKSRHKILDVGCGPGDLTVNYLLPMIPQNGEMLGVDISKAMIQFAKTKYNKDPRLSFEVMDISKADVVKKYSETFDSVFSFYCLHWVQDQWITMKNIYDILQAGGEILLVFLASSPIYTLYEKLATTDKWAQYMHDYKGAISPYHDSVDPEAEIKTLLTDVGFEIIDCSCKQTTYTMPDREILYKSIEAVNPFLNRVPENLRDEYRKDCEKEIENSRLCSISDKTGAVAFTYSLITVYATKPGRSEQSQI